jgi:hypothetical protein
VPRALMDRFVPDNDKKYFFGSRAGREENEIIDCSESINKSGRNGSESQ